MGCVYDVFKFLLSLSEPLNGPCILLQFCGTFAVTATRDSETKRQREKISRLGDRKRKHRDWETRRNFRLEQDLAHDQQMFHRSSIDKQLGSLWDETGN